jgi:hypothetical protein
VGVPVVSREYGVSDVVIDLGELPSGGRHRVGRALIARPPRPYRTVLGAIAIVLAAMLTGAAHVNPPEPPLIIPARLGDSTFVVGDRLFVVSAGPELIGGGVQNKIVSTYALPSGALLSLTTVAVTGAIYDVTAVGDTVLVSYQADSFGAVRTVAIAAGTDRALWRRPARLLGISPSDGLVLLREKLPQFGPLHWYGIDLLSGDIRWMLEQPVDGYITETGYVDGFPRRLVTVNLAGRLEVRDTTTGAVTAATTIEVPADWAKYGIALWPDGDLILAGDHTGATAYAVPDLTERWRAPVDLYSSYIGPGCGDAVCLFSPRDAGIRVLDRATGRDRWTSDRWSYGDQAGPYLIVGGGQGTRRSQTLNVVATMTGRVRGDFGPWHGVGPALPDGTVVGLREQPAEDVVWYARLDPATLRVQVLGAADHVSGDCQTAPDVLVCRRVDASVGIWKLG